MTLALLNPADGSALHQVHGHDGDRLALRSPVLAVEVIKVAAAAAVPCLLVAEG